MVAELVIHPNVPKVLRSHPRAEENMILDFLFPMCHVRMQIIEAKTNPASLGTTHCWAHLQAEENAAGSTDGHVTLLAKFGTQMIRLAAAMREQVDQAKSIRVRVEARHGLRRMSLTQCSHWSTQIVPVWQSCAAN